jgi:putative MFS transporter
MRNGAEPSDCDTVSWRLALAAAAICAFAFGIDLSELTLSNVLSTLFIARPAQLQGLPLSWLLSAIYVGAIFGAPLVGILADRLSFRTVLGAVVLWLGVTSLLTVVSNSALMLMICRLLSGLALGAYPPLMVAYLMRLSPKRGGMLVFTTCALAYLAPPGVMFAVKWLIPKAPYGLEGWRWPYAAAAVGCLFIGFAFQLLPAAERAPVSERVPLPPRIHPTKSLRFALTSLIYFLIPFATVAFPLVTGPALLARHVSMTDTLTYVSLSTVGPAIGTLIGGLFVDRLGRGAVMSVSAGLMAVACVSFFYSRIPYVLVAAVVLFSLASALFLPAMTVFGAEQFPRRLRGRGATMAWSVNRLGAVVSSMALIPLSQANKSSTVFAVIVGALAAIIGLVVALSHLGPSPDSAEK